LPDFEVERATSNEIARLRGEWERLAIGHVQRRLPRVREPYIAQARRTLRRAYDAEVIAELINSSLVFFDH